MKKRIFSLVLALMLCLSLAPMAALAASGEATVEPAEPTGEIAEETLALEGTSGETTEGDTTATDEPSVHSVGESGLPQEGDTSDAVSYDDPTEVGEGRNKTCPHYTVVKNNTTTWSDGWYVVQDNVTIDGSVTIPEGNAVNLILCDGASLTVAGAGSMSGIGGSGSLTVYGQSGGTGALTAKSDNRGKEGDKADCYGIKVDTLTVNGGSVTAMGGNASAIGGDGAYSYGIYATSVTVNGGTVNATGGGATGTSFAESCGIYASQLTTNGQITAQGGDATATSGSAFSHGIYATSFTATGGSVTATGGACSASADSTDITIVPYAESYGVYIYAADNGSTNGSSIAIKNADITAIGGSATASATAYSVGISIGSRITSVAISDSTITATAGSASAGSASEPKPSYSIGILAKRELAMGNSRVTATAGEADEVWDFEIWEKLAFTGSTIQSKRVGGAVRIKAHPLEVSGGTVKLAEGSRIFGVKVSEGVKLADLPVDGCAYHWFEHDYPDPEEDLGFVTLGDQTELAGGVNEYRVEVCTHSTTEGVCAYCGKDLTPEPTATPAPTAVPTATPAPTEKPQAPNTGDEANVVLWLVLATVSVFGVAVVGRKKVR